MQIYFLKEVQRFGHLRKNKEGFFFVFLFFWFYFACRGLGAGSYHTNYGQKIPLSLKELSGRLTFILREEVWTHAVMPVGYLHSSACYFRFKPFRYKLHSKFQTQLGLNCVKILEVDREYGFGEETWWQSCPWSSEAPLRLWGLRIVQDTTCPMGEGVGGGVWGCGFSQRCAKSVLFKAAQNCHSEKRKS